MNCYEHTFITKQDLSESQAKNIVGKYEDIIKTNSGKILKTEKWGLRNLSHKIKNNKKGFYFHIKFTGNGKTIKELEKAENIDDMLFRFLTVKVKKHDLETNYFENKDYENNKKFYEEKIQTANFFFNLVLPRVESYYLTATSGSKYIMDFKFN